MPSSACQTCALDRKSTRLNSSHTIISYAVFCLKKNQAQLHPSRTKHDDAGRAEATGHGGRAVGEARQVLGAVAAREAAALGPVARFFLRRGLPRPLPRLPSDALSR